MDTDRDSAARGIDGPDLARLEAGTSCTRLPAWLDADMLELEA